MQCELIRNMCLSAGSPTHITHAVHIYTETTCLLLYIALHILALYIDRP